MPTTTKRETALHAFPAARFRARSITAFALVLLGLGLARPAPAQPTAAAAPHIEVLFVLDSTGSMSSAIHEAKERILAIAESVASGEPRPDVRFGIVTYRDRGDAYVTKRWALTRDWAATKAALAEIVADGGGDTPEAVIQALHEGIRETKWTLDADVMKVVYLIGDAPPKLYDDDPDYKADLGWAVQNGIVLQSIGCDGIGGRGADFFREVALATEGHYHALGRGEAREVADDEVRGVEEDVARRVSPETLAAVVERTARAYSGEMGVAYEEADAEPVATKPLEGPLEGSPDGPAPTSDAEGGSRGESGLVGDHVRVVRDAATWRRVWAVHTSTWATAAPLPPVDFHAESVVVVTVTEGGLAGVTVARRGDTLVVRPLARPTGPRFAMTRIPASDGTTLVVAEGGE